jgi:hypothetical protein
MEGRSLKRTASCVGKREEIGRTDCVRGPLLIVIRESGQRTSRGWTLFGALRWTVKTSDRRGW